MGKPTKKGWKVQRKQKGSALKSKAREYVDPYTVPRKETVRKTCGGLEVGMHRVIIDLKQVGDDYFSYKDALRELFDEVRRLHARQNGLALMQLEQTCGIEYVSVTGYRHFDCFFNARDKGYARGYVIDGRVV